MCILIEKACAIIKIAKNRSLIQSIEWNAFNAPHNFVRNV